MSHFSTAAHAQEVEYDYRYHKFYDTEEESLVLVEGRISSRFSDIPVASSLSEYTLRSLNFRYMGERGSERNIFGGWKYRELYEKSAFIDTLQMVTAFITERKPRL